MINPILCCNDTITRRNIAGIFKVHKVYWGTIKKDGIRLRCKQDGSRLVGMSRSNTEIPNNIVQMFVDEKMFPNAEGEVIVDGASFNDTQSWVMTANPPPKKFTLCLFDYVHERKTYLQRLQILKDNYVVRPNTRLMFPEELSSPKKVLDFFDRAVSEGEEGIVLRSDGIYKPGRSTFNEGLFFRLVDWMTSEATILQIHEKQHNTNEKQTSRLGYTKRSSHQAGMVGARMMGAMTVRDSKTGVVFDIGSGWNQDYAVHVWKNKKDFIWQRIKYKCKTFGSKVKPRSPIWIADMPYEC